MPDAAPVTTSATLAADASLARRRRNGEDVVSMTSGEIGLPVHPLLKERLAEAVGQNAYGPVPGSTALRTAVSGYWDRRGLGTDPDLVVCGPGSKALLFGLLLAVGGDVILPNPSWVSYAAQAELIGARALPVPIVPGEGGVPDPRRLRGALTAAKAAGCDPRAVLVTVPDNPTGTMASADTIRELGEVARELDLVIISDEIYRDLVFDPSTPAVSPAVFAPERTAVTTGLTKNLALGGWRLGVARLPDSPTGRALNARLFGIASQIWSSPAAPIQVAATCAFDEPRELVEHLAASRRLHKAVAGAVADRFRAAGLVVAPVRTTCYLYPDFAPLRTRLARVNGVRTGAELTSLLVERYGIGTISAEAFGEAPQTLRLRAATSRLYGETEEQRHTALAAADPLLLPWIRRTLDRLEEALLDLAGAPAPRSGGAVAP
ncbi:pyridoxal phosphate-dependent aminotransferase [Streptomonospora sp. PA3]|uniref:pyridoxal phosphate-dependent aminotransferase n=1 Tax=Streptomonospora sp. PA3 TaxID=2607326 RepID=UPI0012DF8CED|nr:pyridoxal phosphate-dependent aminotransferase [Streptomonospora sp. PA3]MUL41073.1 pyridoxal phosphate-dependent aminotransferase [Streptomonospora sp. PA3]